MSARLINITIGVAQPHMYVDANSPVRVWIQLTSVDDTAVPNQIVREIVRVPVSTFTIDSKDTRYFGDLSAQSEMNVSDHREALTFTLLHGWDEFVRAQEIWLVQYYQHALQSRINVTRPVFVDTIHHHTRTIVSIWQSIVDYVREADMKIDDQRVRISRAGLERMDVMLRNIQDRILSDIVQRGMDQQVQKWTDTIDAVSQIYMIKQEPDESERKSNLHESKQSTKIISLPWHDDYVGLFWFNWLPFQSFVRYPPPARNVQVDSQHTYVFQREYSGDWKASRTWHAPRRDQVVTLLIQGATKQEFTVAITHTIQEDGTWVHTYTFHPWSDTSGVQRQAEDDYRSWEETIRTLHMEAYDRRTQQLPEQQQQQHHLHFVHLSSPYQSAQPSQLIQSTMCQMLIYIWSMYWTKRAHNDEQQWRDETFSPVAFSKRYETNYNHLIQYVIQFVTRTPILTMQSWVNLPRSGVTQTPEEYLSHFYQSQWVVILRALAHLVQNKYTCWIEHTVVLGESYGEWLDVFRSSTLSTSPAPSTASNNDEPSLVDKIRNGNADWKRIIERHEGIRVDEDALDRKRTKQYKWFRKYGHDVFSPSFISTANALYDQTTMWTQRFQSDPEQTMFDLAYNSSIEDVYPMIWISDDHESAVSGPGLARMYGEIQSCNQSYVFVDITLEYYRVSKFRKIDVLPDTIRRATWNPHDLQNSQRVFERVFARSESHANILMMDRRRKRYIWFEPHGELSDASIQFMKHIMSRLFPDYQPYEHAQQCNIGLQAIHSKYVSSLPEEKQKSSPVGFCLAWTYAVSALKMLNPSRSFHELVQIMYRGGRRSLMDIRGEPLGKVLQEYIYSFVEAIKCLVMVTPREARWLPPRTLDSLYQYVFHEIASGESKVVNPLSQAPMSTLVVLDPEYLAVPGEAFMWRNTRVEWDPSTSIAVVDARPAFSSVDEADGGTNRTHFQVHVIDQSIEWTAPKTFQTLLKSISRHEQPSHIHIEYVTPSRLSELSVRLNETAQLHRTENKGDMYVTNKWLVDQRTKETQRITSSVRDIMLIELIMQRARQKLATNECRPVMDWVRSFLGRTNIQ